VISKLEPETRRFVDKLIAQSGPPIETLPVEEARRGFELMQSGGRAEVAAGVTEDRYCVPAGDVPVHVVRPANSAGNLPVIVYFHGGGWVLGSYQSYRRLASDIAISGNAAVVFVEYTLSPEASCPVAVEQGYVVTGFFAQHAAEFGLDGSRLAVAGDSAGGAIAAAVALTARERRGPNLAYQVLLCPMLDANFESGSYCEFAEGPLVTRSMFQYFWDAYAPDANSRRKPETAPLQATLEQLSELPPALVITSEFDVVRDEGEAYARKLREAGVPVRATRYAGTIHDFMMLNGLADAAISRSAIALIGHAIRDSFARTRAAVA
jgi:acetyl esterase